MLTGREPVYFSASALGAFCANCRRSGMRTLSPAAVAAAKRMLAERLDRIAEDSISPVAVREITDIMLDVIEQQIDRKLTSRRQLELPA
ncbi:MAG: DNA repair protein RecO C-terminal domain-containing protein [Candidatus Acidiferrales bacterium]